MQHINVRHQTQKIPNVFPAFLLNNVQKIKMQHVTPVSRIHLNVTMLQIPKNPNVINVQDMMTQRAKYIQKPVIPVFISQNSIVIKLIIWIQYVKNVQLDNKDVTLIKLLLVKSVLHLSLNVIELIGKSLYV